MLFGSYNTRENMSRRGRRMLAGSSSADLNVMKGLDPAAMRRFDVKVEFKPHSAWQRERMYEQLYRKLGIFDILESVEIRTGLGHLETLTLGDFAAVARDFRLSQPRNALDVLESLIAEQRHKPFCKGRRIGFV